MPLIRFLALLVTLLAMSNNCFGQQYCAVRVELVDRNLNIHGASCSAALDVFWQRVEKELPKPLPSNLRSIGLIGYDSPDLLEAMSRTFGAICKRNPTSAADFVSHLGALSEAQVRAPTLSRLRPILYSVDNYYVLRLSNRGTGIRSPGCKYELLRPVLYYRLQGTGT